MALEFNGTTQYVNTGYAPTITSAQSFTYAFWFKLLASTASVGLFGYYSADTRFLSYTAAGVKIRTELRWGGGNIGFLDSTSNVDDSAWHHIAIVRDVVADIVTLYMDGVDEGHPADGCVGDLTLPGNFFVGCYNNGGVPAAYCNCQIDDLSFWLGTALTTAQVEALAKSKRRLAASLVSPTRWWPLQGGNGAAATGASSIQDYSANLGHGTPVLSPLYALSQLSWPAKAHTVHAIPTVVPLTVADQWNLIPEGASPFSDVAAPSSPWSRIPEPTPAWA